MSWHRSHCSIIFRAKWCSSTSGIRRCFPIKTRSRSIPNVSLVLQSDGFGAYGNKLGDYQVFVQQDMLEYGGYKLFFSYSDGRFRLRF